MKTRKFVPISVQWVVLLLTICLLIACGNIETTVESTKSPVSTPTPTADNAVEDALPENNDNNPGIDIEQDSLIPPIPPSHLSAVSGQDCTLLQWQGTGSDIIVFYTIYRRGIDTVTWTPIGITQMEGDNRGSYEFCDTTLEALPSAYEYAISSQDHYGNESALSEPFKVND